MLLNWSNSYYLQLYLRNNKNTNNKQSSTLKLTSTVNFEVFFYILSKWEPPGPVFLDKHIHNCVYNKGGIKMIEDKKVEVRANVSKNQNKKKEVLYKSALPSLISGIFSVVVAILTVNNKMESYLTIDNATNNYVTQANFAEVTSEVSVLTDNYVDNSTYLELKGVVDNINNNYVATNVYNELENVVNNINKNYVDNSTHLELTKLVDIINDNYVTNSVYNELLTEVTLLQNQNFELSQSVSLIIPQSSELTQSDYLVLEDIQFTSTYDKTIDERRHDKENDFSSAILPNDITEVDIVYSYILKNQIFIDPSKLAFLNQKNAIDSIFVEVEFFDDDNNVTPIYDDDSMVFVYKEQIDVGTGSTSLEDLKEVVFASDIDSFIFRVNIKYDPLVTSIPTTVSFEKVVIKKDIEQKYSFDGVVPFE